MDKERQPENVNHVLKLTENKLLLWEIFEYLLNSKDQFLK